MKKIKTYFNFFNKKNNQHQETIKKIDQVIQEKTTTQSLNQIIENRTPINKKPTPQFPTEQEPITTLKQTKKEENRTIHMKDQNNNTKKFSLKKNKKQQNKNKNKKKKTLKNKLKNKIKKQNTNKQQKNNQNHKKEKDEKTPTLDEEVKEVLKITDNLLEQLPDDIIEDFAQTEEFQLYEKVFQKYNIKK